MTDVNPVVPLESGPVPVSDESRAQILNVEVAKYAQRGWSVQSVTPGQAVVSKNKRIGWFWNTVLVFVTVGFWLIVVIYRALNRKKNTVVITVDQYGKVRTN